MHVPSAYAPTTDPVEAYNRCDPKLPLQGEQLDHWYVDCAAVRGVEDFVERLADRVRFPSADSKFGHAVVAGHRGCGKSTELRRLKGILEHRDFVPLIVEAQTQVTADNLDAEAVLLIAVKELVTQLSRNHGIQLNANKLKSVRHWFGKTTVTEDDQKEAAAELGAEASGAAKLLVAGLKAVFKGHIRYAHKDTQTSTVEHRRYLTDLQADLNDLFADAQVRLQRKCGRGTRLALIMDGLDRIEDEALQKEVFVDFRDLLSSLQVDTVFTIPISLVCSPYSDQVQETFGSPEILPSIKVDSSEGLAKAREIVLRRCDETLFEPGVVDLICQASGGDVRDIMYLIREAILHSRPRPPISMSGALAALHAVARSYSNWLTREHYAALAAQELDREATPTDAASGQLLMTGAILCYWNGGNWYRVHPAIRGLPKHAAGLPQFKQAVQALQKVKSRDA